MRGDTCGFHHQKERPAPQLLSQLFQRFLSCRIVGKFLQMLPQLSCFILGLLAGLAIPLTELLIPSVLAVLLSLFAGGIPCHDKFLSDTSLATLLSYLVMAGSPFRKTEEVSVDLPWPEQYRRLSKLCIV